MDQLEKKVTGITIPFLAIKNIEELREKIKSVLDKDTTFLFEAIFSGAISLGASDVHFEPGEVETLLKFRLDGILYEVLLFPTKKYKDLLLKLKMISGMKINVTDRPQDGRFTLFIDNKEIEIRSSTLASEKGEPFVCRVLDPTNLKSLEELGLRPDLLELFKKEIKRPHGMIIVTGPTGAGKTTTLYAFLSEIKSPEIKIITIENPIEYRLSGVIQTQVDPQKGYDFVNGLRAIMRQDPDVILVGEIRDLETAELALQASLTGHLVLSTLHTNDAAGVVSRFLALGAKPFHIAPAVKMVVAQRLVRKVCKKCAKSEKIDSSTLDMIKKFLHNVKGVEIDKNLKVLKAVGCKDCNFTGYKGRCGVFEAFVVDEEIESLILQSVPISTLKKKAIEKGMVTLLQDGLLKVLNQTTTLDEIERVVGFFED